MNGCAASPWISDQQLNLKGQVCIRQSLIIQIRQEGDKKASRKKIDYNV